MIQNMISGKQETITVAEVNNLISDVYDWFANNVENFETVERIALIGQARSNYQIVSLEIGDYDIIPPTNAVCFRWYSNAYTIGNKTNSGRLVGGTQYEVIRKAVSE